MIQVIITWLEILGAAILLLALYGVALLVALLLVLNTTLWCATKRNKNTDKMAKDRTMGENGTG